MKAFFGSEELKNKYVARLRAHREADELVQGTGWRKGKGCAMGCTFEYYNHKLAEAETGVPSWLYQLYDKIFERLGIAEAKKWAVNFLDAIQVGDDLNRLKVPVLEFILDSAYKKVESLDIEESLKRKILDANRQVKATLSGSNADVDTAYAACRSADETVRAAYAAHADDADDDDAADAYAYARAAADVAYVAYAAADVADVAYDAYAAARVAYAADVAGARQRFWTELAELVLRLLKEKRLGLLQRG